MTPNTLATETEMAQNSEICNGYSAGMDKDQLLHL